MIHRVLFRKYVEQSALLWSGCALALFAFNWIRVWVVSLLDMSRFRTIVEQFREYERFSPISFDQLTTYPGRIGMTFDEPVVIFCVVVWCVARGSDVVSGEVARGTLEMLLAQPISRTRLLMTHAAVSISGLALLVLAVWLGMWVGVQLTTVKETVPPPSLWIPFLDVDLPLSLAEPVKVETPMRNHVDSSVFAGSILNLFALGFFLLGLSTLMSSWDRYRWRTIGVVITIYVLQLVMFGLGKAAEQIQWLTHLSFFDLYRPQQIAGYAIDAGQAAAWQLTPVEDGAILGPLTASLILIAMGLVAYAAAIRIFATRDLPAPL